MQESEKRIYYDIITRSWTIFSKQRPYTEFSDKWWESLISDFDEVRKLYLNTDYSELVNELTMKLQNEHERRFKQWKTQQ